MTESDERYRNPTRVSRGMVVAGIVASVHSAPALAYMDPGTGSIILQGMLAGIAAALAAGSLFWSRIKARLSALFLRKTPPGSEPGRDHDD